MSKSLFLWLYFHTKRFEKNFTKEIVTVQDIYFMWLTQNADPILSSDKLLITYYLTLRIVDFVP